MSDCRAGQFPATLLVYIVCSGELLTVYSYTVHKVLMTWTVALYVHNIVAVFTVCIHVYIFPDVCECPDQEGWDIRWTAETGQV